MNQEQKRSKSFSRRAALVMAAQSSLLLVLGGRLYQIQIQDNEKYTTKANENRIDIRAMAPSRGRIFDRFGNPLALNQQNYSLNLVAEKIQDLDATLEKLRTLINLRDEDIAKIRADIKNTRKFKPVTIRENVSWEEVSRIEVSSMDLLGVYTEAGEIRRYHYGGTTAHILGYVGAVNEKELESDPDPLLRVPGVRIGKTGIEHTYEKLLRGEAGTSEVEVNAYGRVIREVSREAGKAGVDVYVSLDSGLQHFTQQRLSAEPSSAAVVLDIPTGEVLALGSNPTFDPLAFTKGISKSEWDALLNDPYRPLTNKAISGEFAPGSTFKIAVAMAALEAGVNPTRTVHCPGQMRYGGNTFHCWKRGGHGHMNMSAALAHSCDVYFYKIAEEITIDAIAPMARRLGLGQKLGIELPYERAGIIPDRKWKREKLGESWYPGENLVAGIGQGFITTTPLQLAVMIARLCSGLAVKPHLGRYMVGVDIPMEEPEPLGFDPRHVLVVMNGMNQVTNAQFGTAYRSRIEIPGMEMAGKTGTSQVRRITAAERARGIVNNEDLPWNRRDHALFVAFAPVSRPRYAISVVVEHGGGGSRIAAPIARDILIEAQKRDSARQAALAEIGGKRS